MKKYQFAVIGHPIVHSISPFVHNRLFEIVKVNAEYKMLDIKPESLEYSMGILNTLDGYNVTIPHKYGIINFLDDISNKARLYQSVNTVKNVGRSVGYTTDAYGFLNGIDYEEIDAYGRVVIVGAGGVASVIAHELAEKNCEVVIAARDSGMKKAATLVRSLKENMEECKASFCKIEDISGDVNLLINATPVGMYPDKESSVVGDDTLKRCRQVYDLVYNPYETKLVRAAKSFGIKAAGGLSMLVYQAVLAHKIWDGSEYSDSDIKQLILDCHSQIDRGFE